MALLRIVSRLCSADINLDKKIPSVPKQCFELTNKYHCGLFLNVACLHSS